MYHFDRLDPRSITSFQNIFNYTTCQITSRFDMPYYLNQVQLRGYLFRNESFIPEYTLKAIHDIVPYKAEIIRNKLYTSIGQNTLLITHNQLHRRRLRKVIQDQNGGDINSGDECAGQCRLKLKKTYRQESTPVPSASALVRTMTLSANRPF